MVKSSIFITALGLAAQVAALPSHFTRNAATTVKFMPLGASIVEQVHLSTSILFFTISLLLTPFAPWGSGDTTR